MSDRVQAAEFDAVRELLPNLRPDRIEAARLVMVEGKTNGEAAALQGFKTRQVVNNVVAVIRAALVRYRIAKAVEQAAAVQALPAGWSLALVAAPASMLDDFERAVEQAKHDQAATSVPSKKKARHIRAGL